MTGRLVAGRYRLERLVGRGGAAEVYRALDVVLERAVAVKLFLPGTEMASELRWRSEIRVLAGLSHPGLVTVFDAGSDPDLDGRPYLVMEFVDGASLADRLRVGPVPPRDVALIGARLAGALSHVHGQGVVHRDVKPGNVLLADREVKLADFGIARLLGDTRLTTVGTTVGTANYLSPEQVRGEEVGPPSDVYSLGLVLLEALTGAVVYPGHGVAAAVARLHRAPAVPAGLDGLWEDLLTRMTAADPTARLTAQQAGAVLGQLGHSEADPAAAATTRLVDSPERRRARTRHRRYWVALIGALTLVALAAIGYALSSRSTAGHPAAGPQSTGATHRESPRSSPSAPPSSTASHTTRPRTAAGAIRELRAAIARAVNTGNLDLSAATDLDSRLTDLARGLSQPASKPDDLGHKVADLLKHLDDLRTKGQLTAAGQRMLVGPLRSLEHFIPPTP